MTEQEMMQSARDAGFTSCAIINTQDIPFNEEFRKYCEENLCGNYGVSYSCPPDCGSAAEMAEQVHSYSRALVLQSVWELDYNDKAAVKASKAAHNGHMIELRKLFRANDLPGLMYGCGCCSLCSVCAGRYGEACPFPEDRWSCLSACCADVLSLAGLCGMEYWLKDGKTAFFGMYCFN